MYAMNVNIAQTLMVLGMLFLAGLAADEIGRRTHLPRVTLLLSCGVLAGSAGLNLIPAAVQDWYEFLSAMALTMVAFLLGGGLTAAQITSNGRAIIRVSIAIVLTTVFCVAGGLWLIGIAPTLALSAGAIACATDPASTQDTIAQSGAKGRFPDTLRGIVAIDDAWGMIVFSLAVVVAEALQAGNVELAVLQDAAKEIGGALALGLVIGLPAATLTGRVRKGEPLQSEALGLVFLTAGVSMWLGVSFLLTGMVVGAVVANRAKHHDYAFHEIEHIQWPFMILFFILAGASLNLSHLAGIGWIGAGYVVLRILSRAIGGMIGGAWAGIPRWQRPWFGLALLPQAGVAVGMALVAAQKFPEHAETLLALVIGTTVLFELIGPLSTMIALRQVAHKLDGHT
ncbi:potassium/proton antiporter [Thalassovita gelatinovora]|uniref:Potassium/proton antiporter n=2 Tax=Thalassovita gelatinovora TaxID=53501 RepID=A0A0P1FWS3_THAGE|nr:potassium/proton antiporter [Thalassovita gelatinovora]SEQ76916.1 transporter, CPA2 family [Thalassovita gelatinovora]